MKVNETIKPLESDGARTLMTRFYGEDGVEANVKRYEGLLAGCEKMFGGEGGVMLLSSSGRTETSGNHTDHNHGKVLVDSINLGCVGVAGKNESNQVHIVSETYNRGFTIDLNHLEPSEKKTGTADLVKGLPQGFKDFGYSVGGFSAYIVSNVISAAGVSSSAFFEMLLCSTLNTFFNGSCMSTVAYAHIGEFAESNYWDEASGLLDQMACVVGGLITIDFMEPLTPKVEKIDFDFGSQDRSLTIVQTGKGHADLNADYPTVPAEVRKVARYFEKEVLSQVSEEQVIDNLAEVRQLVGDRSVPRALRFLEENKRVEAEVLALKESRSQDFLTNTTASGNSLWKWFQNCFTNSNYQEQGITVTLVPMELLIAEEQRGACRIHGGSFVGVIVAVLPNELMDESIYYIEKCTGEGSAYRMSIRSHGAICFNDLAQLCSVLSA